MVADHLMIKVKPGIDQTRLDSIAQQHGATIRRTLRAPGLYLVSFEGTDLDALPTQRQAFAEEVQTVAYAEPDYLVHAVDTVPDDARFDELWGMHNTGQTDGSADADIDAVEAWDIFTGNRRIDPTGNGDGFMKPGEQVEIWLTIGNEAAEVVSNLTGTLRLEDPRVELLTDTQPFMFAGADFVYTSSAPFVVQVAPDTTTPLALPFDLVLSGDQAFQDTNTLELVVYTSSTISGLVRRARTDEPLVGAHVSYEGTVSGVTTTDTQGAYSITAVNGTYALVASFPGPEVSQPHQASFWSRKQQRTTAFRSGPGEHDRLLLGRPRFRKQRKSILQTQAPWFHGPVFGRSVQGECPKTLHRAGPRTRKWRSTLPIQAR